MYIDKSYFTLPEILERWQITEADLIYLAENDKLRLSVRVFGVPIESHSLKGMDSLLSIVQMPGGVPVATVGVGNAKNAGLLAVRILAASSPELCKAMVKYQSDLRDAAAGKGENVRRHSRP